MRALITALPQYHEILQRMTLHIQVGAGQKGHAPRGTSPDMHSVGDLPCHAFSRAPPLPVSWAPHAAPALQVSSELQP